ncbi:hypothetical protein DTO006G1_4631 [Penicillium roqueforti]|uniref:uncharacterized protein n=1 Tax=Penicillium roqueforti TaxID=5082 RepID=UPI00190E54BA|nr:uncharacterized protein LCP9604111_2815 [Penicillium roqueforti]KAF9251414.1 hypothetical protein LCP9604111_2815 [Penicillium roqueforti]KAI1837710.1 hypothetical protein CBS147337_933 [Penicillium roqueforti]KAI2703743.1 hypothetical protein CBS147372_2212 [Penicillium roqueforti]KAI2719039.1 hypothetical protein CBS147318_4149 [Penicillium roqueforti]KAI2760590.1 hypothetical protein DTO006G1_4631 [Penicillium roqueforti]
MHLSMRSKLHEKNTTTTTTTTTRSASTKHALSQLPSILVILFLVTLWFRQRTPAQKRKLKTRMQKERLVRRLRAKRTYDDHVEPRSMEVMPKTAGFRVVVEAWEIDATVPEKSCSGMV